MDEQQILLKPGQQIKPHVPLDVVHSLARSLFRLEVTSVKELNSYDDRNFHIKVSVCNLIERNLSFGVIPL